MNDKDLTKITVSRFDPTEESKPHFETYKVPFKGYTVMNALDYIYENYDTTLAFRGGCLGRGSARCGACPVVVNGVPALSCQKVAEQNMVIEPHTKFDIVKDLVIDMNSINKKWKPASKNIQISIDQSKCTGCADCVNICQVKVYELQKINGKMKAVAIDEAACCGDSCLMCSTHCSNNAILIKTLKQE